MTDTQAAPVSGSILVVGGGISGLTTALEAAEVGYDVILVEKNPYLGGRVAQLNQYFPKLCPPSCGLEINFRRIKDNPRVKVLTLAEVEKITGGPGAYEATVKIAPRFVTENCTCCGECAKVCQTEVDDAYNFNMAKAKAARLPHPMAFPARYVIDASVKGTDDAARIAQACKYDAVDFDMTPKTVDLQVGAVVWATGWEPYDATRIDNLKFGVYPNVITNMMMERLAAVDGPTDGKILRPSDGAAPASVAFVQCAGSRDENHLPYCSYICCMASLKQATYVRKQYPDTKVYIFYIDIRSPGDRYEKFYNMVKNDENVVLIKGKVAEVIEDSTTRAVTVVAENAVTGEKIRQTVDMAVLATGMQPTAATSAVPGVLKKTDDGFIINDFAGGLMAAGCAGKPADVYSSNQNATGMALKAIQTLARK